jgi:hypothetical protein
MSTPSQQRRTLAHPAHHDTGSAVHAAFIAPIARISSETEALVLAAPQANKASLRFFNAFLRFYQAFLDMPINDRFRKRKFAFQKVALLQT